MMGFLTGYHLVSQFFCGLAKSFLLLAVNFITPLRYTEHLLHIDASAL